MESENLLKITATRLRSITNTCRVSLSDSSTIELSIDLVAKYALAKGRTVTRDELESICREQRIQTVKSKALGIVSRRSRSVEELRAKLKEKGYETDEIDLGVGFLKEFGYLDDEKYATDFARNYIKRKPSGAARVEIELRRRGIASETAKRASREALGAVDAIELAMEAAQKKLRMIGRKPFEKQKQSLINFLRGKGFDWDVIRETVGKVLTKSEE